MAARLGRHQSRRSAGRGAGAKASRDRALAPGFSDLAEIDEIGNIHELALDYDDLLDHLKLDGLDIVGHSFGARVAAEIAAHFPRRAKKLVLLAPVGLWNDAYPVTDIFAEPFLQVEALLWHDNDARDALAARRSNEAGPQSEAERIIAVAQGLTAVSQFIWPIPDKGLHKRLPRIAAQTLALFGEKDSFVPPRYAEDFAKGLRQVQTGHHQRRGPHGALRKDRRGRWHHRKVSRGLSVDRETLVV